MILQLLRVSITSKIPISFEYNRPGKISGLRLGNPHAVFIFTSKAGEASTKVHLVQTGGVTDTSNELFPCWKQFNIEHLSKLIHLVDEPLFEIHVGYNPEWEGYQHIIERI